MQTTSSLSCSRVERAEVHRFSIRSTSALETRRRRSKFRFDRWIVYDNGTREERKFPRTLRKKFQFVSSSFAREDVSRSKWNNWYRLRMLTKTREWGMRFARKKWKVEEGGQLILESIANGWRRTVKQFQKFEWQVTIGHVRFASSLRAWPDENREKGNRFLCTAPRNGHVRPPFLVVSLINPECLAWKPLLFVSALGGHG